MNNSTNTRSMDRWESPALKVGFILAGLAITITGVSYLIYMEFPQQWLVWIVGAAFIVVGFVTVAWSRGLSFRANMPENRSQRFLILSIPAAFVLSSQVCGLGLRACTTVCHITNALLIVLGVVMVFRLNRMQNVGLLLAPMVLIGLIPHCVCHAPINTVWHGILGGVSPTCEMMPLAASLFAITSIRGIRVSSGRILISVLFAVMLFIIVGGMMFGFPWQGCVDHPV